MIYGVSCHLHSAEFVNLQEQNIDMQRKPLKKEWMSLRA